MNISSLVRTQIQSLESYSAARHQYLGEGKALLDANENPYGDGVKNRYPDPNHNDLRSILAESNALSTDQVIIGNGSDEIIDLLLRVFCEPNKDSIMYCSPTFGMYKVAADINAVEKIDIPLGEKFQLNADGILAGASPDTKILFLCSPNSPTGNLLDNEKVETIISEWNGIVVVDEAYIEFADAPSWAARINEFPNLVVLRTLSKYWGLAGCRVGYALANKEIITYLLKVKPPYNVDNLAAKQAIQTIQNPEAAEKTKKLLLHDKAALEETLQSCKFVRVVHPSDTNFLFVELSCEASLLHSYLKSQGIVVRTYTKMPNTIRISLGSTEENTLLTKLLNEFSPSATQKQSENNQ